MGDDIQERKPLIQINDHLRLVGWLNALLGAFTLVGGCIVWGFYPISGEPFIVNLVAFGLVVSGLQFAGGVLCVRKNRIGEALLTIPSLLWLFGFPFGTMFATYNFWVFFTGRASFPRKSRNV